MLKHSPIGRVVLWRILPAVLFVAALLATAVRTSAQTDTLKLESANGVSGVRIYEPGRWGIVRGVIANHGDRDATPLLTINLSESPLTQFCSRVWVPAGARREVFTPFLPESADASPQTLNLESRLVVQTADHETAAPPQSARAICTHGRFDSGILADDSDDDAREFVGAFREAAGLKRTTLGLASADAPTIPDAYEALDTLFISRASLDLDPTRLNALRRWLERGGRVWIMLDQVSPESAALLLGEDWDVSIIDTVEATEFAINGPTTTTTQRLDVGVPLLRICAPSFEVTHWISGSPVAMHKSVGRGELVVTMLAARGWLDDNRSATQALKDLQSFVAPTGSAPSLSTSTMQAFRDHIRREIGYRVIERRLVILVFGAGSLAVFAAGLWLSRRGRLEYAGAISVAAAVAAAAVLIAMGSANQSKTPSTVASAQLVQFDGRTARGEMLDRTSFYTSPTDAGRAAEIRSNRGGAMHHERAGSASLVRYIWDDPETSTIEGVDVRGGAAATITTHGEVTLASTPRAIIGFDASGLAGRLDLPDSGGASDALVATSTGCIAVHIDPAGRLTSTSTDLLDRGEFSTSALLTQLDISRQGVLRTLLVRPTFPTEPSLLLWTDPLPSGIAYSGPAVNKGSALLVIPLTFERPPAGTEVSVPSPLMSMLPFRQSIGKRAVSTVYNPDTREWLNDIRQPMLVVMRYLPPRELFPMSIQQATITVEVRASGWDYQVVSVDGDRLRALGRASGVTGRTELVLSGDQSPPVEPDGSILIGIDVKPVGDPTSSEGWSVRRMALSVIGRTR
jgi:hypothetical protein